MFSVHGITAKECSNSQLFAGVDALAVDVVVVDGPDVLQAAVVPKCAPLGVDDHLRQRESN